VTGAEREAMDAYTDRSPALPTDIQWCSVTNDSDQVRWGLFGPRTVPNYVERDMCARLWENASKPELI